MAYSKAYQRVKNTRKENGIWLTTNQLRELATSLEDAGAGGVAFMVGNLRGSGNKTVEVLPFQTHADLDIVEEPTLTFFNFRGLLGHFVATLRRVRDSNSQFVLGINNDDGGGGGNQKTPPPSPTL